MTYVAAIFLGYGLGVLASMLFTALRNPVRGTGGPTEPPIREKPSADEATTRRAPPA